MLITIEHLIRSLQRGQPPFLIPHRGRLLHLQTGVTQHREKAGIRRKARVLLIKKEGIVFLFQLCRKMVQDRLLLILAGQQGIILEQAKLAQRLIVQLKDQRRLGRLGRLTGPTSIRLSCLKKGIAFLLFSTGIPLRSSYKPIDSLSKESPYSISSCGTICINPFAGSVKKESGPEVVRKLSTKAFNDTLQYKTIQSVFLPRKVEKYYQNRYAFRQEFILLRKITATRVAVKSSSTL